MSLLGNVVAGFPRIMESNTKVVNSEIDFGKSFASLYFVYAGCNWKCSQKVDVECENMLRVSNVRLVSTYAAPKVLKRCIRPHDTCHRRSDAEAAT